MTKNNSLRTNLLNKLFVAQKQKADGDKGKTLKLVMLRIRKIISSEN
jgi:hypothetical protein